MYRQRLGSSPNSYHVIFWNSKLSNSFDCGHSGCRARYPGCAPRRAPVATRLRSIVNHSCLLNGLSLERASPNSLESRLLFSHLENLGSRLTQLNYFKMRFMLLSNMLLSPADLYKWLILCVFRCNNGFLFSFSEANKYINILAQELARTWRWEMSWCARVEDWKVMLSRQNAEARTGPEKHNWCALNLGYGHRCTCRFADWIAAGVRGRFSSREIPDSHRQFKNR